jgi:hypothetical protein
MAINLGDMSNADRKAYRDRGYAMYQLAINIFSNASVDGNKNLEYWKKLVFKEVNNAEMHRCVMFLKH